MWIAFPFRPIDFFINPLPILADRNLTGFTGNFAASVWGRGEAHFEGSFCVPRASLTLIASTLLAFPFCGLTPAQTANEQTTINNVNQTKYLLINYLTLLCWLMIREG